MEALKNAWYVAAWPEEIDEGNLVGRTILNEPILLYRKTDGTPVAIGNRCPHRFAPLHLGRHLGDTVRCGYHGLEFGEDGRCARNPHGNGTTPSHASVPTYPLVEKHSMLWIWMGSEPADESLIADEFAFVADPQRAHVKGSLNVKGNYMLLVDNLMDLSHGLYLHAGTLSNEQMQESFLPKAHVEDGVVYCNREQPGIAPPALWVPSLPSGTETVDYFSNLSWHQPSNVIHPVGCRIVGKPEGVDGGVGSRSAHMFTPETDTTTHYFYSNSRDYGVDDPEADKRIRGVLERVFGTEDAPMIEAQQQMIGDVDLNSLRPAVIPSDRPMVLVRRQLAKLIAAEKARTAEQQPATGRRDRDEVTPDAVPVG
ncbi:aromatic ring-hydroxylating dioxygenase subunit alpha [Pseudonocardia sp. NPDC046786]|uniref:aromatic ring-hydroxylating dioxygenase subunit alpha n=1 Tax=Pseudonocardia sp. NPDC046786 TaxID=3155471 RepID=UPI0033F31191